MRSREYSYGVIPVKKSGETILFLLVKHAKGHWDFPKGRMEDGETDVIRTALRELEEEGSVYKCTILSDVWFEDNYECAYNGVEYDKTVRYFLGIVLAEFDRYNDPDGDIVQRKWLPYEQAVEQLTHRRKKEIAKLAKEYTDSHPDMWILTGGAT